MVFGTKKNKMVPVIAASGGECILLPRREGWEGMKRCIDRFIPEVSK